MYCQIQQGLNGQSDYNNQEQILMNKLYTFKIGLFCFILTLASTQLSQSGSNSTSNITFAAPPPINTSIVGMFNDSTNDGRFIGSRKLESLRLDLLLPAGGPSTNFQLTTFDRNALNNIQIFQLNQTGNWTIISTTQDSLSCSLAYEYNSQSYGFVQFNNNSLNMVYSSNLTLNINNTANIVLKQNCFAYIGNNLTFVNSTGLFNIPTPFNWTAASSSQSINYGVANNVIYRFNPSSMNFTSIYTLPQNSFYEIRNYQGNLIIAASNTSANSSVINQTFYIFSDQSSLTLIGQFSISGKNLANQPILPYLTSPQLTKLGVFYIPANSTNQTSILKSINFNKLTITNLNFQQPNRILSTTINIPAGNLDFSFGDNYYIIRNGSGLNISNPAPQNAIEQAYQFVGDQVIFLRNRNLTGKELTDYRRTFIDTYYQNQLVVLDTYVVPGGLQIDQFIYGNLVSINRIVPLTPPSFMTFTIPVNNLEFVSQNALSWAYLSVMGANTYLTMINANPSFPNNTQIINSIFSGNQTILAMNDRCLLLRDLTSNNITIARPPANISNSSNISFTLQDITQKLMEFNVTSTVNSTWTISNMCDRFAIDSQLFSNTLNQSTYMPIPFAQPPTSFDPNLAVAIIGGDIWTLNPINNSFVLALNNTPSVNATNPPPPILPMSKVFARNNLIVVTGTNTTSAQVYAYSVNTNGMLKPLLNYFFPLYQGIPKIQVSSNLTKVIIIGPFIPPNKTQIQPKIDAFFIDSANGGFQNITFPFNSIPEPVNSYVLLDEQYLYIRSLTSNFTNSPNGTQPQQNIYFINQNIAPELSYSVNLTQVQVSTFTRAVFTVSSNGSLNNFVEFLNGSQVIVNKIQTSPQQARLNGNSNILGLTAMISDGVIKLCSPGCSDCSTGSCSGCTASWVFDSSSYSCYRCGLNCASCSLSNTQLCYTCLPGSFLSANSTCLRCDGCLSCSGTATNCTSCPPSKIFLNGTCNNTCTRNCISCSTTNDCLTCAKGFVLANGTCRGCSFSCSNCSATNITQCTSCAPGLSLVNSTCISCPEKCQVCNNGACATCIPGYTPNAAGSCVLSCSISCATCVDNQPTSCLSCYGSAILVNSQCLLNTSCNNASSCTDCGQGLGYILVSSVCVQCPAISNCLQCSATNSANCSICMNGYYIDNDYLCSSCSTGCLQCTSGDICIACAVGYTLPENYTQGQCLQCQSPCATCIGVATYCLTCASGFTKRGWKCQNNTYCNFKFTLSDTPTNVLANIDYIVTQLLTILNISTTNVDTITFSTIVSGSTVVSGVASTQNPSTTTSTLSTSLSSGSLGTYTVTSSSVSTNGESESSQSKGNTGLIIGLVVGFIILIGIVIIVGYCIYKKKQGGKVDNEDNIVIQLEDNSKMKNQNKNDQEMFVTNQNIANQSLEKAFGA